jgi:hypothetical protein
MAVKITLARTVVDVAPHKIKPRSLKSSESFGKSGTIAESDSDERGGTDAMSEPNLQPRAAPHAQAAPLLIRLSSALLLPLLSLP